MSSFARQFAIGRVGESKIAAWLQHKHKFSVLPVYDKAEGDFKGPVFFTRHATLIAPDMLAMRQNDDGAFEIRWVEAKSKGSFTWHRLSQRWVTGIDRRHYADYINISEILPSVPIWLMFLQGPGRAVDTPAGMTSPTGLYGGRLEYLRRHENHRHDNWGKSGMVYWALQSLTFLAPLREVDSELEPADRLVHAHP
jgi:hypothetical protein